MRRDVTLADVLYHRKYTSSSLQAYLSVFHKDSSPETKVRMADYVLDRTYVYTVGELRAALQEMYEREASPQLVNENNYENLHQNKSYYHSPHKVKEEEGQVKGTLKVQKEI